MFSIKRIPLPDDALLARYLRDGGYADCYATEIARPVSHAQFVRAFYTTWLFKLERWLLSWAVARPSTDAEAARLAAGETETFAAWSVEARAPDQLLMCDFQGRTRSWLMVLATADGTRTCLLFGSAVVPSGAATGGRRAAGNWVFRLLLGFHKLYSIALLRAARVRLASAPQKQDGQERVPLPIANGTLVPDATNTSEHGDQQR